MSECRACRSEIDPRATKCPRCQAFQRWYGNPQVYSVLLLLPLFSLLFFWQTFLFGKKIPYPEHKQQFSVERVREVEGDGDCSGRLLITYRITNRTEHRWEHLSYQLAGKDEKGDLVLTKWGSEYSWLVEPEAEAYVTARVESNKNVHSWDLQIADLEVPRL